MPPVAVRAGHELALLQRVVGDHLDIDPHGPERAAAGAEGLTDLVVRRRTESATQNGRELLLAEPVVAAHERKDDTLSQDDGYRLRGRCCVDLQELGEVFDRRDVGRLYFLGRAD